MRPRRLALLGPTASGKSEAALVLAPELGAEVVSVDSMLVYRGMDVGTAKPNAVERAGVPHHLVDVADPSEDFSVARFQDLARFAVSEIEGRGRRAMYVGGSGLYWRAAVDHLEFPGTDPQTREELVAEAAAIGPQALHRRLADVDPPAARRIEPANVRRTVRALEVAAITGRTFSSFAEAWESYPAGGLRAAGVRVSPAALARRIERRVASMLEGGLLEEVRSLAERGLGASLTARQAIGYAEMLEHLGGRLSLEEAVESTVRRTRALARRQMSWFRRDPRIAWFDAGDGGAADLLDELREFYAA